MKINTTYLFLDASVFVRYIPNLKLESILKKIFAYKLITCEELLTEILNVCLRKQFTNRFAVEELINYTNYVAQSIQIIKNYSSLHIEIPIKINKKIPINDPKDWYIHNLALTNNVTVVTGDKHLLELKQSSYPIFSAFDFLTKI